MAAIAGPDKMELCSGATYMNTSTALFTHDEAWERKKEHHGEKRFTLQPVVCYSAVDRYTGAYELEDVGVWEQRQPPGNIPPLPSLSQVKTVWKHTA